MECDTGPRCLTTNQLPDQQSMIKRAMISYIAKIYMYDVLGWFLPSIIMVQILLQCLWEEGIHWDDPVPDAILE